MAIRQKYSRKITVGASIYRWHLAIDDDYPWLKQVLVLAEGNSNGAQLGARSHAEIVSPGLVRRVIEMGLSRGWNPRAGAAASLILGREDARAAFACFPREIVRAGHRYVWEPEGDEIMNLKIWSPDLPDGQVLRGGEIPWYDEMTDGMAGALAAAALEEGWQPEGRGLEDFRLAPALAGEVLWQALVKKL